jgi:hypothetical protein
MRAITIPDFAWYSSESKRLGLKSPRCPFQNVNTCPRYFYSLSLLRDYGCTKIEKSEDERLATFWKNSPLTPQTSEQDTRIDSTEKGVCSYHNFCPEVAFDRFRIFATYFSPHVDEIDTGLAHERLGKEDAPSDDPRWDWRSIKTQHYGECPFYSQLSHDWPKVLARPQTTSTAAPTAPVVRFDVFISHATEDKEDFVRPLAVELVRLGLRVWFDEWTLKIGDSLRQKIDEGLAASEYGVVVVSRSFFAKNWPQAELDGLFAREMQGRKVILPVWHDITKEEVLQHSPMLAGKLAAVAEKGVGAVAAEIYGVLRPAAKPPALPASPSLKQPDRKVAIAKAARYQIQLGKRHRHLREKILKINPRRMADFYGFEKVAQLEACETGVDEFPAAAIQKLREFFFVSRAYLEGDHRQVFDSFDIISSADDCKKYLADGFQPYLLCLNEDREDLLCWSVFHKEEQGLDRIITANAHGYFASTGGGRTNIVHLIEAVHHHGLRPYEVWVQRVDRKTWAELESCTFYHKGMGGLRGPDGNGQDSFNAWFEEFLREHRPKE